METMGCLLCALGLPTYYHRRPTPSLTEPRAGDHAIASAHGAGQRQGAIVLNPIERGELTEIPRGAAF